MDASVEQQTASQGPIWVVGLAHGTTHWIVSTFFVSLPFIASELGLTYTQAGLLVSSFYVAAFVTNFGSGAIVDLTGRRVGFQMLSLVAGAVAILGMAASSVFGLLCAAIALMGAANNLWHPPAFSFLSQQYPVRRGYALAIHALFASLADAIAPVVAGTLLTVMAWRGALATSALPSLIAAVMLIGLLRHDNISTQASGSGMSGAHYRQGIARLLRDPATVGLALVSGLRSMVQVGLLMFLPLYLANEMQVSPVVVGMGLMAMQIGGLVVSPIAGILSDRIGRRPIVAAGLALSMCVVLAVALAGNQVVLMAELAVLGFALFAARPVIHSWMMDLVPGNLGASGTSLLFGVQAVLSALIPLVGGAIADAHEPLTVFYVLAAALLVAAAGAAALPGPKVRLDRA